MAVDAMVSVGMPPSAAGPPDAAAQSVGTQGTSGDGQSFSKAIESAIDQSSTPVSDEATAPAVAEPTPFAATTVTASMVDVAQLIATVQTMLGANGQATPATAAVPDQPVIRPDRDAEAEDAAASLAALVLGGVVAQPIVVPKLTDGGIAAIAPVQAGNLVPVSAELAGAGANVAAPAAPAVEASPIEGESSDVPSTAPVSEYGWRPVAPQPVAQPQPAQTSNAPVVPAVVVAELADAATADVPAPSADTSTVTPVTDISERIEATSSDLVGSVDSRDVREERTTALHSSTDGAQPVVNAFAQATQPVQTTIAPVATATVDASSGPALARGLADTVHAATLRGDRELRVTLNPPDLGQVTVHITEHDSGGVTVAIQASSHEAHELMQQQLPALRAGLEQREVRVERLHVEQQASSSGLGWADGGQRQSSGQREAWASRDQQQWSPIAAMDGTRAVTSRTSTARVSGVGAGVDGRVDLRA